MNKWCFLLIAACLLAPDTGHAALKARDDVKAEDAFNPNPAPDDLILPVADRAGLQQVDPQTGQKAGDGVQVRILGPTGQDFVADDQDSGSRGGLIGHARQIGAACPRVIGAA